MKFQCPKCGNIVSVDISACSKIVACGHCNKDVRVPSGRTAPGAVIGDFVIKHEVGHGGMGMVYEAHQISLDRPAAVKILLDKFSADANFIADFVKEARSAAKLNHPNIVQAYAVGEEDGIYYFAMEFIDGETMKSVLAREGKVPIHQSAEIIASIAEALDFAWNEQKLVHRDIKPDNIILMQSGRAKLADLGLAQRAGESGDEDSDEVMGTPQYISPEQLTGAKLDTRSDLYSLGATFYHFVTGRFPYQGPNGNAIARQHVEGTLIPPNQINPAIPDEINAIIVKMMQKDPNNRYPNGGALARELRRFCEGRDTTSRAIPPVMPTLHLPGTTTVVGNLSGTISRLTPRSQAPVTSTSVNLQRKPAAVTPKGPLRTTTTAAQPKVAPPPKPPTPPAQPAPEPNATAAPAAQAQPESKKPASKRKVKKTSSSSGSGKGRKWIVVAVLLIGLGVGFHFLAVSGKVSFLNGYAKHFAKSSAGGETPAQPGAAESAAASEKAPPPKPSLSPEVSAAIDAVAEYRWKNARDHLIFLDRVNALRKRYQRRELALSPKWHALYDDFVKTEERQILDPAREEAQNRASVEINARLEIAKQRAIEQQALAEQRREAERARQQQEAERRRRQREAAQQQKRQMLQYQSDLLAARSNLIVRLVDANRDSRWDESRRIIDEAVAFTRKTPRNADRATRQKAAEFAQLVRAIQQEMQDSEAITQAFNTGSKALEGMQIEIVRPGGKRQLFRLVDLKKDSFIGKALLGDGGTMEHPITDAIRVRMCRTVERRLKLPPNQRFHYSWRNSLWEQDLQKIAPKGSYWEKHLEEFLQSYFQNKYPALSPGEQNKFRARYGHLTSFKKAARE